MASQTLSKEDLVRMNVEKYVNLLSGDHTWMSESLDYLNSVHTGKKIVIKDTSEMSTRVKSDLETLKLREFEGFLAVYRPIAETLGEIVENSKLVRNLSARATKDLGDCCRDTAEFAANASALTDEKDDVRAKQDLLKYLLKRCTIPQEVYDGLLRDKTETGGDTPITPQACFVAIEKMEEQRSFCEMILELQNAEAKSSASIPEYAGSPFALDIRQQTNEVLEIAYEKLYIFVLSSFQSELDYGLDYSFPQTEKEDIMSRPDIPKAFCLLLDRPVYFNKCVEELVRNRGARMWNLLQNRMKNEKHVIQMVPTFGHKVRGGLAREIGELLAYIHQLIVGEREVGGGLAVCIANEIEAKKQRSTNIHKSSNKFDSIKGKNTPDISEHAYESYLILMKPTVYLKSVFPPTLKLFQDFLSVRLVKDSVRLPELSDISSLIIFYSSTFASLSSLAEKESTISEPDVGERDNIFAQRCDECEEHVDKRIEELWEDQLVGAHAYEPQLNDINHSLLSSEVLGVLNSLLTMTGTQDEGEFPLKNERKFASQKEMEKLSRLQEMIEEYINPIVSAVDELFPSVITPPFSHVYLLNSYTFAAQVVDSFDQRLDSVKGGLTSTGKDGIQENIALSQHKALKSKLTLHINAQIEDIINEETYRLVLLLQFLPPMRYLYKKFETDFHTALQKLPNEKDGETKSSTEDNVKKMEENIIWGSVEKEFLKYLNNEARLVFNPQDSLSVNPSNLLSSFDNFYSYVFGGQNQSHFKLLSKIDNMDRKLYAKDNIHRNIASIYGMLLTYALSIGLTPPYSTSQIYLLLDI